MASTLYSGFKTQGRSQPKEEWQALAKNGNVLKAILKEKCNFLAPASMQHLL